MTSNQAMARLSDFEPQDLFREALQKLWEHFGASTNLAIHTRPFGEVQIMVLWTGPISEVRAKLDAFDAEWWLQNIQRGDGRLTIGYHLLEPVCH